MSDPKRHHYVPQMTQRRFANERGLLWYFNKDFPEKGIGETGTDNLFVKSNLHTGYENNGSRNTSLETFYSQIETKADQIINRIVTAARDRRKPNISEEEKRTWDHFIFFQWKRVPDCHNELYNSFDDDINHFRRQFEEEFRPLTREEEELFDDTDWRARMRQNVRVDALRRPSQLAVQVLNSRGLGIATIRRPNKSFVLGSFPVVKLTNSDTTHLAHPSVEFWLPVASDVAVTPLGKRGEEVLLELPDQLAIRHLNEAIFRQSTIIAGRSRQLIASLADSR